MFDMGHITVNKMTVDVLPNAKRVHQSTEVEW